MLLTSFHTSTQNNLWILYLLHMYNFLSIFVLLKRFSILLQFFEETSYLKFIHVIITLFQQKCKTHDKKIKHKKFCLVALIYQKEDLGEDKFIVHCIFPLKSKDVITMSILHKIFWEKIEFCNDQEPVWNQITVNRAEIGFHKVID